MNLALSKRIFVLVGFVALLFAGPLHAKDSKAKPMGKGKMELTAEQRTKMADMHEKAAACLRSSKSMDECHNEMKSSCKEMGDVCPMMMGKMHGHHMMHDEKDGDKEQPEHK